MPIIALTANALNDKRDGIMQHGFDSYLSKPIQLGLLGLLILEMQRYGNTANLEQHT